MPGPTELIIVLVIVVLLFGGTRLAGIGKASGRAIREFKEETRDLTAGSQPVTDHVTPAAGGEQAPGAVEPAPRITPDDTP